MDFDFTPYFKKYEAMVEQVDQIFERIRTEYPAESAAFWMPSTTSPKIVLESDGNSMPKVQLRADFSLRPKTLGRKPSSAIAACTLWVVGPLIDSLAFTTRDTVEGDTPARLATSFMVIELLKPVCPP